MPATVLSCIFTLVLNVWTIQVAILEYKSIICAGYSAVMHIHTCAEEVSIKVFLFAACWHTQTHMRFLRDNLIQIGEQYCQHSQLSHILINAPKQYVFSFLSKIKILTNFNFYSLVVLKVPLNPYQLTKTTQMSWR